MRKLFFLISALLISFNCHADRLADSLGQIEADWAKAYFSASHKYKSGQYQLLIEQIRSLAKSYPDHAEPLIWQANIIATNAELQNGFDALAAIHQARDLLLKAIIIDPKAMDGSAYVTLGSLYHMVPSWPLAFGDDKKARESFQMALKINPEGIDANYFYGEFLASQDQYEPAAEYFKKAIETPARSEQLFADSRLKDEARLGLANITTRKISGLKSLFMSLFNSASAGEEYQ